MLYLTGCVGSCYVWVRLMCVMICALLFSQYLELRFCKAARVAATLIYIVQTVSVMKCSVVFTRNKYI